MTEREDYLRAYIPAELQRLDRVLERRRIPVPEYAFKHSLVQEVAYRGLLTAARRARLVRASLLGAEVGSCRAAGHHGPASQGSLGGATDPGPAWGGRDELRGPF